jgi:fructoselysine 6-kinase
MTRILALGDNTIDTYVDAGVQYPGGNAVNVAAMAARLGASTAYLGCVGSDEGGHLVRAALAAEGVDISRVRTRPGANARAFIGHTAGDRHFIRSSSGVRADYRWEDADFAYIATFDHVHTSIYSDLGEALLRIAASARSLSFDASNRWTADYLRQVTPHVRFIFLSASDLSDAEATAVAESCMALGAEAVVLTRGSGGALGVSARGAVFQPALPTLVVDTLGAGDGFISGCVTAILAGATLNDAMTRGAEFAAQVCGWRGGFGHAVPWTGDPKAARAAASK